MNAQKTSCMLLTLVACANICGMETELQKLSVSEQTTLSNQNQFVPSKESESMAQQALYHAALNHTDVVINFLKQGLDPNTNNTKMSLLDYAAQNGNSVLVDTLLKDPNRINNFVKPFDYALKQGYSEIAKHILTAAHRKKDILAYDDVDYNFINTYTRYMSDQNTDILNLILSLTSDAPTRYKLLTNAASAKLVNATTILLDQKAHVYQIGHFDKPLLHTAIISGSARIAKLLIDYGVNTSEVSRQQKTPFQVAVQQGEITCLQLLLGENTPVKEPLVDSVHTLLCYSEDEICAPIIQLLVDNKCDVSEKSNYYKDWPLIVQAADRGHIKTVSLLLKYVTTDINATDNRNQTALDRVIVRIGEDIEDTERDNFKAIKELLIAYGAKTSSELK